MGKATQAMAEKYRFYKTCLQVEIIQSENGINLAHQTNPEADIDWLMMLIIFKIKVFTT